MSEERMKLHDALPVAGYRPQSTLTVDMVNRNKETEEAILRTLDAMVRDPNVDKRWLAIGRTHMEQAWMAINRSIFKPGRVALPADVPSADLLSALAHKESVAGVELFAKDEPREPAKGEAAPPALSAAVAQGLVDADTVDTTSGADEPDHAA